MVRVMAEVALVCFMVSFTAWVYLRARERAFKAGFKRGYEYAEQRMRELESQREQHRAELVEAWNTLKSERIHRERRPPDESTKRE